MPELPEVETVRRQLDERLRGVEILGVDILESGREFPSGREFVRGIFGRQIESVQRRAKLLIWQFTGGEAMIAHLKMTGRFVFVEDTYVPTKHDRIIFSFTGGRVVWSDVRKFGFVKLVSRGELKQILAGYGLEPLEHSVEELAKQLENPKSRMLKSALLNQGVIAGIGNIYADESLFRAGIMPTRRLGDLNEVERLRLAQEIKSVLAESVAQQGTSANDYVDTRGEKGGFLELLRVYGREGEPCKQCKNPISKIMLGQRGTHFCEMCQK